MKAFVFTDERLREFSGQFVWLEIDIEKAENAAFRRKFPVRALPTYLIVDPKSEFATLRWVGGATTEKLSEMLADARDKYSRGEPSAELESKGTDRSVKVANALLERADLLYAANKGEAAAAVYHEAIDRSPDNWASYSRAVEALLILQSIEGRCPDAVQLAKDTYARLAETPSVAIVAGAGLDCSLELPDDDPGKAESLEFFENAAQRAASDLSIPIPADDRSSLYISLYSARLAASDSVGARTVAQNWAYFLERTAASAPNAAARTVFDSHRLSAYLRLKQPARAIPMLEASARDFPEDYNPPARLAIAYKAMDRWGEGLTAIDAAIERAYGPREIGLLTTRAQLLVSNGEPDSARVTLERALQIAENLPDGQRSDRRIENVQRELTKLLSGSSDAPGSE